MATKLASMPRYRCLSSTPVSDQQREALTSGLTTIEADRFDTKEQDLLVEFIEVAEGQWFTAATPSQATVLSGTVPDGTTQDQRAQLMDAIGRMAATALDKDFNDIMVVASDGRRQD